LSINLIKQSLSLALAASSVRSKFLTTLLHRCYGIEAMFKDCKTGGYNLEGCQASPEKLIALMILIAIVMTSAWLRGKRTQLQGQEKYLRG
jgi:hypothetical protein